MHALTSLDAPGARRPLAVVSKINTPITAVLQRPEVREQFNKLGISPLPMEPEEFGRCVRDQIGTFQKISIRRTFSRFKQRARASLQATRRRACNPTSAKPASIRP